MIRVSQGTKRTEMPCYASLLWLIAVLFRSCLIKIQYDWESPKFVPVRLLQRNRFVATDILPSSQLTSTINSSVSGLHVAQLLGCLIILFQLLLGDSCKWSHHLFQQNTETEGCFALRLKQKLNGPVRHFGSDTTKLEIPCWDPLIRNLSTGIRTLFQLFNW